ncbi:MAG: carboxylate-amine ligase, partial [Alphaproteobacteria bacterium]
MALREPRLRVGIEEEYLLVDRTSRDLASDPPESMLAECEAQLQGQVAPEFLRAQIEVGTRPCRTVREARADLAHLRTTVARVAERHGLAPIAASTHPFARWEKQQYVEKERYRMLARDLQAVARRLLICGMHVHVEVDDNDLRIDLMNQMTYFLPHLLTLSTSSPFWGGEDTGLKSYRLTVFDALPRTGLPDRYESFGEFQRVVGQLISAGLIEDATKLWWDLRPSARFPTLEMRIADVCTRLDDA